MSSEAIRQLRESYDRVIEATVQKIRTTGLLKKASKIDELRSRWVNAMEAKIAAMEQQWEGKSKWKAERREDKLVVAESDAASPVPSLWTPRTSAIGTPRPQPMTPRTVATEGRVMDGVIIREGLPDEQPPSAERRQALGDRSRMPAPGATNVRKRPLSDDGDNSEMPPPSASRAKRAKTPISPAFTTKLETPLSTVLTDRDDSVADHDDFDDAFSGAVVHVANKTPSVNVTPATPGGGASVLLDTENVPLPAMDDADPDGESAGSELGSDLDDSEFEEPQSDNILFADIANINRGSRRWTIRLRHGVLSVGGVEKLFSSAHGVFDLQPMALSRNSVAAAAIAAHTAAAIASRNEPPPVFGGESSSGAIVAFGSD